MSSADRPGGSSPVTEPVELLAAQLRGLALWHAARRAGEQPTHSGRWIREDRLDARRRLDARQREHQAIIGRLDLGLHEAPEPMRSQVPSRAVVAHRHAWTRDKLSAELSHRGIEVLCAVDNGADAVGVCVVEQPDLLIVDELLAMRTGCEVAVDVRRFCSNTLIAGYVEHETAIGGLLDAGASTVYTRRTPPADAVEQFATLLKA